MQNFPARPVGYIYMRSASAFYLFIFNAICQTNYLKICQTDRRQCSRVRGTTAVDSRSEIRFSIPRGTLPWQPILFGFIYRTDFHHSGG